MFQTAGSEVILNAYPYPGYVFTGWSINCAAPNPFVTEFTLNEPANITPLFVPGTKVSFITSPPGLQLLINHTPIPTRTVNDVPACPNAETQPEPVPTGFPAVCFGDFYFAPGSTHDISAVTPQRDTTANWWVFTGWSNGLGQNALYQVPNNTAPVVLTADYVAGAEVALLTSPNGLQLTVDGQSTLPSYNFVWGLGSSHQMSAPATQTGSNGRIYTFQNWSNGGSATQSYTVTQAAVAGGFRMTANYSEMNRIVIQSSPTGLTLQVDGANCVTPCNVDRESGATFKVSAPTQFPTGTGSRLDFGYGLTAELPATP